MRSLILVSLLLAACTPLPATTPLPTAQVSFFENTPVPVDLATYRDAEAGIELDYPPSWTVVGGETQSRSSYVQIVSWDPGPDRINSIPEGGSVLQITIYLWNPTGDLDARVEMRRVNFYRFRQSDPGGRGTFGRWRKSRTLSSPGHGWLRNPGLSIGLG